MVPSKLPPRRVVHVKSRNTQTTAAAPDVGDVLVDDSGGQWVVTESPAYDGTPAAAGGTRTYRNGGIE